MPSSGLPTHRLLDLLSIDKWAHLVFYAVESYLLLHALSSKSKESTFLNKKSMLAVLFGSILGLVIEMFQWISPSRHFDYFDIIANIIGCITGVLFYKIIISRTAKT